MGADGVVHRKAEAPEAEAGAATNVVDFMTLLQQSIANKSRTPAKKAGRARADEDEEEEEKPARSAAKKTAKRATTRKAAKKTGKTTRRKSA